MAGDYRGGIFQRAWEVRAGDGHLKEAGASPCEGCKMLEVHNGPELTWPSAEGGENQERGGASPLDVLSWPKF